MNTGAAVSDYAPVALYLQDSDSVEYVRRDVPSFERRIDEGLTLILSLEERDIIGFRLKGYRNAYLRDFKQTNDTLGQHFVSAVSVLERMVDRLGDIFFDEKRKDGYRAARQMAADDNVKISDSELDVA